MSPDNGKLIIFSAPSGSGKTTLVRHLLEEIPKLSFSISATSREPRGKEKHGHDYYFLSNEDFDQKVENNEFLEWEEVYAGNKYGTLRSEVERLWSEGKHAIFDIDVVGGLNLKKQYGDRALAVFVKVPSLEELENRLRSRQTESEEKIQQRVDKAYEESKFAEDFDTIIVNENLAVAKAEAFREVSDFIG
jgi:guanylate kinase